MAAPGAPTDPPSGGPVRGARRRAAEPLAFALVVLLHLVSVWALPYFPSQDGPAHLENAAILRDYHRADRPLLARYYALNPRLEPTWAGHLALAGLVSVLPPLVAEKVFLSGYLLLFPFALRYALRALGEAAVGWSWLGFPLLCNYLFHMGFYSFSYSVALLLLTLGFFLHRRRGRGPGSLGWGSGAALAGLALLLWACHPVSWAVGLLAVAILGGWFALREAGGAGGGGSRRALGGPLLRRFVLPVAAFLPPLLLALAFAARQRKWPLVFLARGVQLRILALGDSLVSFDYRERIGSVATVALLAGLTLYALTRRSRQQRLGEWDGLLLAAAAAVVLYFAAPHQFAGGGWITFRLALFPYLLIIPWLAAQGLPGRLAVASQALAAAIALGMLASHLASYRRLDGYVGEYLSVAPAVAAGSTLLPVTLYPWDAIEPGRPLAAQVRPLDHAAGYLAAGGEIVVLANYEAHVGYFPVVYRPQLDPYRFLVSGDLDLDGYRRRGGRVDYVLVWGRVLPTRPAVRGLLAKLARGYDLIATSPRGLARLYRARAAF
jgi:hypothetical protein